MNNQTLTTVAVVALAVVTFALGFIMGNMTAGGDSNPMSAMQEGIKNTKDAVTGSGSSAEDYAGVENANEVAFTISGENLTDGQRKMLDTMGIDSAQLKVTYAMLACAEAEIGSSRVSEIQNGATPSFSEGLKLVGCYE